MVYRHGKIKRIHSVMSLWLTSDLLYETIVFYIKEKKNFENKIENLLLKCFFRDFSDFSGEDE